MIGVHVPRFSLHPGRLVRATSEDIRWLERVRATIEAEMAEESFSVQVLADRLAVHRSRLHERVRHLTGLPPVKLISRSRLARAAALLQEQGASVTEAAFAVGFQSVEHFSRSFRKLYGQPPSRFRRNGFTCAGPSPFESPLERWTRTVTRTL